MSCSRTQHRASYEFPTSDPLVPSLTLTGNKLLRSSLACNTIKVKTEWILGDKQAFEVIYTLIRVPTEIQKHNSMIFP